MFTLPFFRNTSLSPVGTLLTAASGLWPSSRGDPQGGEEQERGAHGPKYEVPGLVPVEGAHAGLRRRWSAEACCPAHGRRGRRQVYLESFGTTAGSERVPLSLCQEPHWATAMTPVRETSEAISKGEEEC